MATFRGITTVEHVPGSPDESLAIDRSMATRVYDVPWADRVTFCRRMLGFAQVYNAGGNKFLHRELPHAHPDYTLNGDGVNQVLWATSVTKMEGVGTQTSQQLVGNENDIAKYVKARITMQYTAPVYDILTDAQMVTKQNLYNNTFITHGGPSLYPAGFPYEGSLFRYVTKISRPNVEAITTPQGSLKRVPHGSGQGSYPVQQGLTKLVPSATLTWTWHFVPIEAIPSIDINPFYNNTEWIAQTLGKVNDRFFAGYPAGTLLLTGVEYRPSVNALGFRIFDIIYTVKRFNPTGSIGHQHIWQHTPPTATPSAAISWDWVEVTTDGISNLANKAIGKSLFDWADYTKLFTPA